MTRAQAQRALYEGAEPSFELIAAVSGHKPRTVALRARREGWQAPASGAALEARITRLTNRLMRELDEMEGAAEEAGGGIDKERLDLLTARMRVLEKLAAINQGRQADQEEQEQTDADIADVLARIDQRIGELARQLAAEYAGDRDPGPVGPAGGA